MAARLVQWFVAPRAAWSRVAAEAPPAWRVLGGWVLPLALLPFAATFAFFLLWTALMGARAGFAMAPYALADAAGRYVSIVAWVVVVAWFADWLAPKFGGGRGYARALAGVGYALTPAFVLSLLAVVPLLGWGVFAVGAVWWIGLLRLGLPELMQVPAARRTAYTAVVVAVAVLLTLLGLFTPSCARFAPAEAGRAELPKPAPAGPATDGAKGTGTRSPDEKRSAPPDRGSGSLQLEDLPSKSIQEMIDQQVSPEKRRELERAARQAVEQGSKLRFAKSRPSELAQLLPAQLEGLARRTLESKLVDLPEGGALAEATAAYGGGSGPRIQLSIGDNTNWVWGLQRVRQIVPKLDETNKRGRHQARTEDDCYVDERWNPSAREGQVSVLVADRFVVRVTVTGLDDPAAALRVARTIDWTALAARAKEPAR